VVLRLLDQVYSLRRALAELNDAIHELPESAQEQLRDYLSEDDHSGDQSGDSPASH
jgi:hypothetical protein